MNKIHISELYPVSTVVLGSELYYICELGKYLKQCGYQLSLNGVVLDHCLKKSRFWDYLKVANYNEWVADLDCLASEMDLTGNPLGQLKTVVNRIYSEVPVEQSKEEMEKRNEDTFYNVVTPVPYQIVFESKTPQMWVWSKGKQDALLINSRALSGTNYSSQSFVSLVAYVAVKRFLTNEFSTFKLVLDEMYLTQEHAVSDLTLLLERTNALDWLETEFNVSEERKVNLGYEAWLYRGRELGFDQREYTPKEKLANFKRLGFAVGDVVGLYERKVSQKGNMVKSLVDFHFAIIDKVSSQGITFKVVLSKKTKYGYHREFMDLPQSVKDMYVGRKTLGKDFRYKEQTILWNDLGVEYMMDAEREFITTLQGDDSGTLVVLADGEERVLELCEFDLIYWILKDYEVDFAEAKFLKKYFPNSEPVYFKVMGGSKDDII